MKQKWTTWVLLAVFVLLIGGAYLLYQVLGAGAQPGLAVEGGAATAAPAASPSAAPEPSAAPSPDASTDESAGQDEEQRTAAPDFTVYDAAGNAVHLSDFVGKPVILNFWASWCNPCKSEMPDFEDAYGEYGQDIQFVMVNSTDGSRETVDTASSFIEDSGYTFPVYFDTDYDASVTYGVTGLPTTFFIDSEGYLVAYAISALDAETLQTGIDMLLPADG